MEKKSPNSSRGKSSRSTSPSSRSKLAEVSTLQMEESFERTAIIDARKYTTREINSSVKKLVSQGKTELIIRNPDARHNLVVGIVKPCKIAFEGSVGYYCCSFCDGLNAIIDGNSGWGLADNLMSGRIYLKRNAGACLGASIHGGEIFVEGDAGARTGILMKGGTILISGNAGFLTGFMMQKGKIIVLGDVGDAAGDSMYEGVVYAGGKIGSLGADSKIEPATSEENQMIRDMLRKWGAERRVPAGGFRKIVSAKRLYHYDALEPLEKERMVI